MAAWSFVERVVNGEGLSSARCVGLSMPSSALHIFCGVASRSERPVWGGCRNFRVLG